MDALGVTALERRRNKIIDLCKVNWRENYCQALFKAILAVELGFVLFCSLLTKNAASYKFKPLSFRAFKEEGCSNIKMAMHKCDHILENLPFRHKKTFAKTQLKILQFFCTFG